jgi:putative glutamine amidotransferase
VTAGARRRGSPKNGDPERLQHAASDGCFFFQTMKKPIIGITSNLEEHQLSVRNKIDLPAAYIDAVLSARGIPIILPVLESKQNLRELYDRIDGLVLIGGRDVSPHFYQQSPHPSLQKAPTLEDEAHITLASWAANEHKPFLAICRGHQILNVALGGTLIQDIPSEMPDALQHTRREGSFEETIHSVHIEPGSRLETIVKTTTLEVNSSHHQAVANLGDGLIASACAPDQVLEAMELQRHPCGISVQWHPERIIKHPGMFELFSHLVQTSLKKD